MPCRIMLPSSAWYHAFPTNKVYVLHLTSYLLLKAFPNYKADIEFNAMLSITFKKSVLEGWL